MLYPKNNEKTLSKELFENPASEYRGTPFWAWNTKLKEKTLLREIGEMKDMGFGGYHMHPRIGLDDTYLGDRFMEMVKLCVEVGKKQGMLSWLYDEDRWPSGYAGGIVTKNKEYLARYLRFTPNREESEENFIARYDVRLDESGRLCEYKKLKDEEPAKFDEWFAYRAFRAVTPWFNNEGYANLLDKKAVQEFVRVTYDRYKEVIGGDFGGAVPAIFTDEPQFSTKTTLPFAADKTDVMLSWTDDVPETFQAAYHRDLLASLPELIWNLPGDEPSFIRYAYHEHISERFADAFADTCGDWCRKNNLMLTGHLMREPKLASQTPIIGEAMRSYRAFGLPGIDMLCDEREYTTAKQAQSASHQFGCPGVLSELYGVTNWDFDFRGHKLQGDWQAALGVTTRVHHLNWMTMGGEAKRDFPAAIGYQSPWYREYSYLENHFARANTALTRGKAHVRVGVIHPIESFWLQWGPNEHTGDLRKEMDIDFANVTEWLLFGQMDFDFIAESLLPIQCQKGGAPLTVGKMQYDAVVVPNVTTLRGTTVERLKLFCEQGGKLIFMGKLPSLIDAKKNPAIEGLIKMADRIDNSQTELLRALAPFRAVEIRNLAGDRVQNLLYQMREDGENRWLFIAQGKKPVNPDTAAGEKIRILIAGMWKPTIYDTMTGEILPTMAEYDGETTVVAHELFAHDSLLLQLEPGRARSAEGKKLASNAAFMFEPGVNDKNTNVVQLTSNLIDYKTLVDISLSESNALLLDMAEYRFDGDEWNPIEEILRIDNIFRKKLGYPLRTDAFAQPYVVPAAPEEHMLTLRFTIRSEVRIENAYLAIENAAKTEIRFNGSPVSGETDGWYCDESIEKVKMPVIPEGESTLELRIPFGLRTHLEWCYLLGDFGVRVQGPVATLTPPVRRLAFGDVVPQGLPFYGGNITYRLPFTADGGDVEVEATQYIGSHLDVLLDGERDGKIAFAPYKLTLKDVPEGSHELQITLYGTRINTFGSVHNADTAYRWFGPSAWRTTGKQWGYEYHLHKVGVLKSPVITLK